jgi:hypothetical protein
MCPQPHFHALNVKATWDGEALMQLTLPLGSVLTPFRILASKRLSKVRITDSAEQRRLVQSRAFSFPTTSGFSKMLPLSLARMPASIWQKRSNMRPSTFPEPFSSTHAEMTGMDENSPATTYTGGASTFLAQGVQKAKPSMDDNTQSVIADLSLDEAVCTPTVMFTASGDIPPTPTSSPLQT